MSDPAKQFPYQQKDEHVLNRKQFAVACCAGVVGGGVAQILGHSEFVHNKVHPQPQSKESVGKISDFTSTSSRVVHLKNGHPILIIRNAEGDLVGFSQKCTHLLCPVHYSEKKQQIICPCHKGVFSAEDGRPLAGPPDKPLPQYEVLLEGDEVFISALDNKNH